MYSIELMIEEHENIRRMLKVLRYACMNVLEGKEICYEDFDSMIDFISTYADMHHHGKEEKILFVEMLNHLGKIGTNLVTHGMLVEHDWGRLFIGELREALKLVKAGEEEHKLDIIANGVGYANHLERHIAKENAVVFTYAEKSLAPEILKIVDDQTRLFEAEAAKKNIQTHYIESLIVLENKYCK